MQSSRRQVGKSSHNDVLEVLTAGRRRQILARLLDGGASADERELAVHLAADERELAVHLAADERETSHLEVPEEAVAAVRIDLRHVQLPALEAAELVVHDRDAGTVAATDHPVWEDPTFRRLVTAAGDGLGPVFAALASERRRVVLSILEAADESMARADLARAVAARDGQEPDAVDLQTDLHHVHLPKLDDAGLVEYDPVDGTVAYDGHPALPVEWLTESPQVVLSTTGRTRNR